MDKGLLRIMVLVGTLLLSVFGAAPGNGQAWAKDDTAQVALVIGNSAYHASPLPNPVNDARDMAEKLRGLGFTVIERENLTTKQAGATLREFRARLTPGAVALFFYAGHGLQVKGNNYLPLVDAEIAGEEDVSMQSINVSQVLEIMEESKTRLNLVFLDACRNNPFARKFRSAAGGLAKVNAPSGTIISFATRPGNVASDGNGRNGLYTQHLLAHMASPGQAIEQVLKRVVSAVKSESGGEQEPWMEGSIEGDFCFGGCSLGALPSQPAPAADPVQVEMAFWDSVKSSRSPEDYQAYLGQYPRGRFATLARARVRELSRPLPASPPIQAPAPPQPVAPAPAALRPSASAGCPGCTCADLIARMSMGVEPLTDVQTTFYRQSCR